MRFQLKRYQERSLEALSAYFAESRRSSDADTAFYAITKEFFGSGIPYRSVPELPGLPYVCIRIPTGGGKTFVAAHAVGLAAAELLQKDNPVVLWLVPSNPIRQQTLAALRDQDHPYRIALEERIEHCEVLDLSEALAAGHSVYASSTVVIVSTMQAFRVTDTEGRRVYQQNGSLVDHLLGIPTKAAAPLETEADGGVVPSLQNVLRLHRPIVMVDEAHNARTELSFETLARFRPSCVLEFTATPATGDHASNVLHSVSAAELNAENMIKLPIRLETRPDWRLLLSDAIAQLNALDEVAATERTATGEYLRPIMLIQAEARRGENPVTVDVVKETLVRDHRIPESQIALATGGTSDLDDMDVLAPSCPVRFVITVQQLREGWDCPFAYVLCSLAQTRSSTAVEQILGRLMRLPRATKKQNEYLNEAYAFSVSTSFAEAAETITDALVQNGFERQDAATLVARATPRPKEQELPFEGATGGSDADRRVTVAVAQAPDLGILPGDLAEKLTLDAGAGTLTLRGLLSEDERDALARAFPDESGWEAASVLYKRARSAHSAVRESPPFSIPLLAIRQGELWEPFETSHFMDVEWDLAKCDPRLAASEWSPSRTGAAIGTVTISKEGRAQYFLQELDEQLSITPDDRNWSTGALAAWLDREIPHPDISPTSSGVFLANALRFLAEERALPLGELVRDKYRLRDALRAKIEEHRRAAYGDEYQALLFGDESPIKVTPDVAFTFELGVYPYQFAYRGARQWRKHFYRVVGDLKSDGEEFECACFLDSELGGVETWVRNLARPPAFWLQTSTDRFYPDFVCRLEDGRYLVVEYKGGDRWSDDDSREKRILGELWAERSGGRCLFIMPQGKDFAAIQAIVNL